MSQSRLTARGAGTHALLTSAAVFVLSPLSAAVHAEQAQPQRRQIEEVTVTAERRESTIQDTSISITAFEGEFLDDFGIRNQEDLANYIPATTIQPYDMAVRGVGRSFRALGGDPGISTYFDGVYSEDFGIASTEGGLWDIERIEVLRGPQGTLYGRNAVGGAINFISKSPTDEFEGEVKTVVGTNGMFDLYSVLSGPVIEGLLNARATGVKRERDGFYDDLTPGNADAGNYGDENYTLTLEFMPFENFSMKLRGNERSYRRRMGGANAAGIIPLSERGALGRDTTNEVFGLRSVLSTETDPLAASFDPTQGPAALAMTGNANLNLANPLGVNFVDPEGELFQFTNPSTGETVLAQRVRPGVDPNASFVPSRAFGAGAGGFAVAPTRSANGLDGNDLDTATNGNQDEFFDHQAAYFEAVWDVTDSFGLKYIGGYTDYFYDRTSDRDLTGNPNSDETFYVSQENENFQHEIQMFLDFGDRATFTSGLFYYEARITQRGDFYSAVGEDRFAQPADYGISPDGIPNAAVLGAVLAVDTNLFSAKQAYNDLDAAGQAAIFNGPASLSTASLWFGDNPDQPGGCTAIPSGPRTCGSFTEYQTENRTEAYAWYNQAEIFINDKFSLTLGLRYAEDQRTGEENVFTYSEGTPDEAGIGNILSGNLDLDEVFLLSGLPQGTLAGAPTGATDANGLTVSELGAPITSTASLAQFNISTGALDPNMLQPTGNGIVRYDGVPTELNFYRPVGETFDAWTYRINLDYEPNDHTLLYAGVTTGYRAGGFNLGNLSNRPVYDQEEITAYEIGWKDQLLDRSLQINMSAYIYDYTDVHQSFSGFSDDLGVSVNNVAPVPEAQIWGIEADVFWLTTENLSLGGNFSFTHSEYTSDVRGAIDTDNDAVPDTVQSLVLDDFNANVPASLFPERERTVNIDGNQMLLVPEIKWTLFGIYDVPLGNRGNLQFRTTYSYTDEVFFSIENNPVDKAPDYYRWDARMSWTSPDEQFVISGFVNNIMNEIGVRQISRYAETVNYLRTAAVTDPRMMGLEFTYRFGAYR